MSSSDRRRDLQSCILFLDEHLIVINKPIRIHADEAPQKLSLPGISPEKYKPAHRLDYETSGCLVSVAGTSYDYMRQKFSDKSGSEISKIYLAGASKKLSQDFRERTMVRGFVGSRYRSSKKTKFDFDKSAFKSWHSVQEASHYIYEAKDDVLELLRSVGWVGHPYVVELQTGTRHQIRTYFSSQGSSLVGDALYGGLESNRLELHSWRMEFIHPITKEK